MAEWKEYKVEDLGTVVTGTTPSSKYPEEFGGEMPFVTPSDFGRYNKWTNFADRTLSQKGIAKLQKRVLPADSVLVTCIGSDMGKVVLNRIPVITNQQINSIVPNRKVIEPEFLYYKLIAMYDILRMYGEAGTAVPMVNKGDFEKIEVTIPPLPEQQSIAAILSSLDDKIDLLHRQNKTLEQLAETLFRQWFVVDAEEGWEIVKLGTLGKIICGKTPSKAIAEYFDGEIAFIKIPDMHGKTFVFDTVDSLTKLGVDSQSNKTIPPKSICVSCIATVGLVVMNATTAQTNQQINTIIPANNIYRYFLYLKMLSMKDELLSMASGGTATDNLNTGDFSNIGITLPKEQRLTKFDEQVNPLFEKIFQNQIQIRTLTQLRDTLLPMLMSGEVRVKE